MSEKNIMKLQTSVTGGLQKYKELQDIIAILGMEELSDEDKGNGYEEQERFRNSCHSHSSLQRHLQEFREKYVPLKETIRGFKMILDGEMDEYPENAFFNVGTIDEVIEKAKAEKQNRGARYGYIWT